MKNVSTKENIRAFLTKKFALPQDISDSASLFKSGLVDSFGVLELIMFLEESFGVTIDTMAHQIHEFDSIELTSKLVEKLRD